MCIVLMKFGRMCACQQYGPCRVAVGFETEDVVQIVRMTAF